MKNHKILTTSEEFTTEFIRCCQNYSILKIAVAWCGNPNQTLPYKYLEDFKGNIEIVLGASFFHTHPDSFYWFKELGANIKVFREKIALFHPKIYLFTKGNKYALFLGSSNLTSGGFYSNIEANTLIENNRVSKDSEIKKFEDQFMIWQDKKFSFNLTKQWLSNYRKRYNQIAKKEKKHGIMSSRRTEEEIGTASWLKNADWATYYSKLQSGMERHELDAYWNVLNSARAELKMPWNTYYFKNIEKRRIIGGMSKYGALGHVAAAGQFRHLLVNGSKKKLDTIVQVMNAISKLNHPLNSKRFILEIMKLEKLGFTMKVWGRLICLVRPDLFCTVSSPSVRINLSKTLKVTQNKFVTAEGYAKLIQLIHSSPWFNSIRPKNKMEKKFWENRVALMDVIFY